MATQDNIRSFHHDLTEEKAGALQTEEVVVQRITEDDLLRMSKEAMPTFWTKTGLRLCLIMFVQGCNQAGYGVDWAVIGNINAYDSWHNYFGFASSGTVRRMLLEKPVPNLVHLDLCPYHSLDEDWHCLRSSVPRFE